MKIKNFTDIRLFLFENRSVKQTIFKNTIWLAVAEGVNKFLIFFLFIYLARILGATEYGKFTFALAFIALFGIIFNFGLPSIVTREFAREKESEREFSAILSLKILLGLAGVFLILIGSFFITRDPAIQKIIWILAIYLFIKSFSKIIFAFFQAREHMEYQACSKILETFLIVGAGFFVIFKFPSAENLSWGYLFGTLGAAIFVLVLLHFKVQPFSLSWNKMVCKKFLKMSWPLAFAAIFTSLYNQIDSIMMGYFGQITQNGWYNAAHRVAMVSLIPMGFISTSFYPVLSRAFKQSQERLQRIWNYQQEATIFLAVPIMGGGIFLARKIIEFLYGSEYLASVLAFQMLMIMVGIMLLYNAFRQILIVSNLQKKFFLAVVFGGIFNVGLNLILIPKYSLYGAAFSTIITHLLIFGMFIRFTLKFTPIKPFDLRILLSVIGAAIGSTIMYAVISQPFLGHLHVLYLIFIGGGVYLSCYWGYRKIICRLLIKQSIN